MGRQRVLWGFFCGGAGPACGPRLPGPAVGYAAPSGPVAWWWLHMPAAQDALLDKGALKRDTLGW